MIATSGAPLIDDAAIAAPVSAMLQRCLCVTPNLAKASVLSGRASTTNEAEMVQQARIILGRGARSVLIMPRRARSSPDRAMARATPSAASSAQRDRSASFLACRAQRSAS